MHMCPHTTIAIVSCMMTSEMIAALNHGVARPITEDTVAEYFMIYCAMSDHEEREVISAETYDRTYAPMPDGTLVAHVTTID